MAENSKIEWTHHTFNPWRGCTKVSDGCTNCYAEQMSGRNPKTLGVWGKHGSRVVASESMWKMPLKWDKAAEAAGERHRVFCASLADVFEGEDTMPAESWLAVQQARGRLYDLIEKTPNLDWLLLTKRPENIRSLIDWEWLEDDGEIPPNVWLGTSVEDQKTADERIPHLLKIPAKVRFLSMEPLLGPVDITHYLYTRYHHGGTHHEYNQVDWVILGGESGSKARPFDISWARSIVSQCKTAGVPVFVKQIGAKPYDSDRRIYTPGSVIVPVDGGWMATNKIVDKKGGDWDEWPEDLRIREVPNV
jgi:protein gp37